MNITVTVVTIFHFLITLFLGFLVFYSFWLLVASATFWFIRIGEIITIFRSLYQAGRWPVGIYPTWLRVVLTAVVPIGLAITVPAEVFTARLAASSVTLMALITFIFLIISRGIWLWGLRNYSGASA